MGNMINKRMVNIKIIMLTVVIATFLTGCSIGKSGENLDRAYDSIKNLEYQEALDILGEASAAGEDERLILRASGIANMGLSKYQDAISCFERSLSLSNGILSRMDYDVNYYLAAAYSKSGNDDEAIDIYNTILSIKPNEVEALYLKGVLCSRRSLLEEAKACFEKAISLEPDNYDMLIKIYVIFADTGYKDVGQEYLKSAMEKGTKKMSNYEKGQISYYLEDYESARTYLEKAKDEEGYHAILLLGKTYETLGDINYAISVYSSYSNSSDSSPEILNELGMCKMNMGDYEGALSAFKQGLNLPNNTIVQILKFNEIVAYEYLGDFSEARNLLEAYIKAYPDDSQAKREYSFLKTR